MSRVWFDGQAGAIEVGTFDGGIDEDGAERAASGLALGPVHQRAWIRGIGR